MSVDPFLVAVGVGVCVILGAALERRTGLPLPVFLVPAGVGLAYVPGVPSLILDPNVVFYVFLPPLIYSAAFFTTPRQWRANWRPITLLAVGLVVATVFAVAAATSRLVGGLGWAAAFVLGAVVSPTDPVAATGVIGRLGAPARLRTVLEGESLVNDGVALVIFAVAVSAATSGGFSIGHTLLEFVEEVAGGLALGAVLGWAVIQVRRRTHDPMIEITISLLTPYAAYVPAQTAHVSGVLATVTAGALLGWNSEGIFRPHVRVQSYAFWEVLTFLLESTLFVLLGTQFPAVVGALPEAGTTLAWWALAVFGVVAAARLVWQFTVPPLLWGLDRVGRRDRELTSWRERLVVGWAGMRGAVTLAAALSVPVAAGHRQLVLFLSFAVILATILVQGLSLPRLIRVLGIGTGEAVARRRANARVKLAEAALERLDELAQEESLDETWVERVRGGLEERIERTSAVLEGDGDARGHEADVRRIERELAGAERQMLRRLVRDRAIDAATARELEHELDLGEVQRRGGL